MIRSEAEYEIALKRIEVLMEKQPEVVLGEPEGDELVRLAEEVVEYEKVHYPME